MQSVVPIALVSVLLASCMPASATAIGVDFLFECGECTPATADHFIGKVGPADYQLKGDGYTWNEVDVESSSISIKSVIDGYTRSPLFFKLTWSTAQYRLLNASISTASSFQTGYSWGESELVVDMGGRYFMPGDQITFNLTASPVPEPAPWLLAALGGAVLVWRLLRGGK